MDTIHDLGGREGFGPIRWQEDDDRHLFHEPWQARTWAVSMMMMGRLKKDQTGWTLDWYRHVLERIAPADYLSMNYFNKWVQAMMATLIDDGVAEVEEFIEGHSRGEPRRRAPSPLAASTGPGVARYAVGDPVVAKRSISSMHTRLPGYVRGHRGVVESCLGPQILRMPALQATYAKSNSTPSGLGRPSFGLKSGDRERASTSICGRAILSPPETPLGPMKRRDGEPLFDEAWQAQALGMADILVNKGVIAADAWAKALSSEIRASAATGMPDNAETYYRAVLGALQNLLYEAGLAREDVDSCEEQWRRAYLNAPHGMPIKLSAGVSTADKAL